MNINHDFRETPYLDIFDKWDSKASARATPQRTIEAAQIPAKRFSPGRSCPFVTII